MTHLDAIDDPFMTTIGLEDDEPMCRICQNTVQRMIGKEELIKPCLCNGTLGYAHRSCMEQWLTLTEKKKCTICEFTFKTKTVLKPITQISSGGAIKRSKKRESTSRNHGIHGLAELPNSTSKQTISHQCLKEHN
ncbi:E3 ubiquitin-protein ligase MARCHF2 [Nematostella vectensis]|uniref:E3 ubiquitin-protein ligase MARCHF2 n=1 Tax=Nematostella vectensis TaxID=45351 RepID=UPI002076E49A|nr:E3 ubiquitin-protein ligase MARCHF2 [Nematostella vectensis]